jgi:Dyp-type peroxidase family
MTYTPPQPAPPTPPAPPPVPSVRPAPAYPALALDTNIQGNVLAAFNKDFEMLLFLALPAVQAQGQAFATAMLPILSANAEVASFNAAYREARRAGHEDPDNLSATWVNLSLTATGLAKLAPSTTALLAETFWDPTVARFVAGAATAPDVALSGPEAPSTWLFGGPTQTIDVVVTLAADSANGLLGIAEEVRNIAAANGVLTVYEQDAKALPGARHGHEHFGFKDGVSQPGVTGFDPPDPNTPTQVVGKPGTVLIEAGEFVLGYPGHDNAAGRAVPSWMFDGSFLVVRRLHQDVPAWWAQAENLGAQALGMSSEQVGAKLVGRWRSGVPVAVDPNADPRSGPDLSTDNDFDHGNDLTGANTPLCAHIRKVNPRAGTIPGPDAVGSRRILRRGIAFGEPFDPASGKDHGPDAPRGLVFACYQASLTDQFEFLQQSWADAANFPTAGAGPDPVIGPDGAGSVDAAGGAAQNVTFGRFVQVQGAVYAFTPSLPTLSMIASGAALPAP